MKKAIVTPIWIVFLFLAALHPSEAIETKEPDRLFPIKQQGVWGYMDRAGKVVIKPSFFDAGLFSEGMALVSDENGDYFFIDRTGKYIWGPNTIGMDRAVFDTLRLTLGPFREGVAKVTEKGLFGYIDKTGKKVLEPQYIEAQSFTEGMAAVKVDVLVEKRPDGSDIRRKNVYINKAGKIILETGYIEISSFSEGLAAVILHQKWGYIDKAGKLVIDMMFDQSGDFSEGMAKIGEKDKGSKGGGAGWFGALRFRGKWGYIDKTGKTIISPRFEEVSNFSEGLAAVKTGGKWGYIDKTGKTIISPRFEEGSDFSEGLAAVNTAGKWGYIDKAGNFLIGPQFDYASRFYEGLARVHVGKKMGYILKTGKFFWGPTS